MTRYSLEIIQATREHFARISADCIAEAMTGRQRVNDLDAYVAYHEQVMHEGLKGAFDQTFPFRQYAHFLASGESVPFLPPLREANRWPIECQYCHTVIEPGDGYVSGSPGAWVGSHPGCMPGRNRI